MEARRPKRSPICPERKFPASNAMENWEALKTSMKVIFDSQNMHFQACSRIFAWQAAENPMKTCNFPASSATSLQICRYAIYVLFLFSILSIF